ncbi:hypothetical protein ZWY2020_044816 [Hordeum vulgare]|nr:hypothetical protein ZWY2020_044816 [Hordeum vulgare]
MLLVPGKTLQGFAEEDGDLRNLMRCRSHLVQTYSDKKGAVAARRDLLHEYVRELDVVAPRFAEAVGRHRLCFTTPQIDLTKNLLLIHTITVSCSCFRNILL